MAKKKQLARMWVCRNRHPCVSYYCLFAGFEPPERGEDGGWDAGSHCEYLRSYSVASRPDWVPCLRPGQGPIELATLRPKEN